MKKKSNIMEKRDARHKDPFLWYPITESSFSFSYFSKLYVLRQDLILDIFSWRFLGRFLVFKYFKFSGNYKFSYSLIIWEEQDLIVQNGVILD